MQRSYIDVPTNSVAKMRLSTKCRSRGESTTPNMYSLDASRIKAGIYLHDQIRAWG